MLAVGGGSCLKGRLLTLGGEGRGGLQGGGEVRVGCRELLVHCTRGGGGGHMLGGLRWGNMEVRAGYMMHGSTVEGGRRKRLG